MMQLAYKEAIKSKVRNRHGCVVARGARVLSVKRNKTKTHPAGRNYTKMLHAEVACIVQLGEQHTLGADMYVCRVMRDDKTFGMSRPCRDCQKMIADAGIKNVFYTDAEGNFQHYEV